MVPAPARQSAHRRGSLPFEDKIMGNVKGVAAPGSAGHEADARHTPQK
jgi:hypothetical protein